MVSMMPPQISLHFCPRVDIKRHVSWINTSLGSKANQHTAQSCIYVVGIALEVRDSLDLGTLGASYLWEDRKSVQFSFVGEEKGIMPAGAIPRAKAACLTACHNMGSSLARKLSFAFVCVFRW